MKSKPYNKFLLGLIIYISNCVLLGWLFFSIFNIKIPKYSLLHYLVPYFLCSIPPLIGTILGVLGIVNSKRKVVQFLLTAMMPIVGFFYCSVTWIFGTDIYQWYQLEIFEHKFENIQHPEGTLFVERDRGTPPFATNWCAYYIGELREYTGNKREIIDFYSESSQDTHFINHLFLTFVEGDTLSESVPVGIDHDGMESEAYDWEADYAAKDAINFFDTMTIEKGNFYVIYFAYIGNAYFDYRCH